MRRHVLPIILVIGLAVLLLRADLCTSAALGMVVALAVINITMGLLP